MIDSGEWNNAWKLKPIFGKNATLLTGLRTSFEKFLRLYPQLVRF